MEPFVAAVALVALVKFLVDLASRLTGGDAKGALKMATAAVAGVIAVVIAAQTDFASALDFGGINLGVANLATQVFVGISVGATAALAKDTFKAVDNRQTEAVPEMFSKQ